MPAQPPASRCPHRTTRRIRSHAAHVCNYRPRPPAQRPQRGPGCAGVILARSPHPHYSCASTLDHPPWTILALAVSPPTHCLSPMTAAYSSTRALCPEATHTFGVVQERHVSSQLALASTRLALVQGVGRHPLSCPHQRTECLWKKKWPLWVRADITFRSLILTLPPKHEQGGGVQLHASPTLRARYANPFRLLSAAGDIKRALRTSSSLCFLCVHQAMRQAWILGNNHNRTASSIKRAL